MEFPSESVAAEDNFAAILLSEHAPPAAPDYVEDEEFPPELPLPYDWMLQPASRRGSHRTARFVAVAIAVLLIVVSVYMVSRVPRPFPVVSFWRSSSS